MLTYVAEEARFTECLTGRDYPLVEDGDYEALEHAYLAAGAEAGGPIMASFDGGDRAASPRRTAAAAPEPKVLVERFVGVWPGETCERAVDKAAPHQHLLEDPAARRHRGRRRRGAARAEPDPARGRAALHRDGRLQPDHRQLHPRRRPAGVRRRRRRRGWPARRRSTTGRGSSPDVLQPRPPAGGSTARRWSSSTPAATPLALLQAVYLY